MDFCEIYHFVVLGVLVGGASFIGILGNTISIVVLSKMPQSPTMTILKTLCLSDNLYLSVNFIARGIPYFSEWYKCEVVAYINQWLWPFGTIGLNCTAWLTVLLTLYRYVAVSKPLHARIITTTKKTYILIAVIIVFTSLATVPRFFEYVVVQPENETCLDYMYTDMFYNRTYQIIYKTLFILMLYAFLPPVVCLILTIRLAIALLRVLDNRACMTSVGTSPGPEVQSRETRITKVSLTVGIVYLIGQIPSVIGVLARLIVSMDLNNNCSAYYYYINATELLLVLNCSVNFFIYLIGTESFRIRLVALFSSNLTKCRCCCNRKHSSDTKNSLALSDTNDTSNTYL